MEVRRDRGPPQVVQGCSESVALRGEVGVGMSGCWASGVVESGEGEGRMSVVEEGC